MLSKALYSLAKLGELGEHVEGSVVNVMPMRATMQAVGKIEPMRAKPALVIILAAHVDNAQYY